MYHLILPPKVKKQLKKLPSKDQLRVHRVLQQICEDPFLGKKLDNNLQRYWSIRVWPYRIIYEIHKEIITITIISIAHRQSVYKRIR